MSSSPRSSAPHDVLVDELLQHHFDGGPLGPEAPHDLRQHPGADRLERADAQRAGFARAQRAQVGLRCLEPGHDRVRMPQKQVTGLGGA